MATLDQIRANFPEAADLSDSEIINRISGAGGLDPKYVAGRFGVQVNDPGFVPTIKRSGAQMVGGVGEVVGDVTGNRRNALTNWADDVAFRNPSGINSLQDVADNPWLAVKESVGNAATFLVPGGALKLGATGLRGLRAVNAARAIDNPLTQAAVAGLPSLGEIGEMQRSSGEAENLAAKYGGALGVGAIENLGGVQRMLGFGRAPTQRTIAQQVADLGATPWRTVGKTALRSGLEEGAEEIPQTFIEKAAGYQDPTTAQNLEEAALGGVMGAIGGGVLGTGYGGVRGLKHAQINRYRQQDLLNPDTPLSTLDNQAQWNREFMARDIGREGADSWYQSHMEGVVQDRDLMVQQRYAQARDASMNDLAAQQMGFQDFADFQRWESEQLARRGRPNINTRMGMSEGAPIPPSVIPYSESIQFNPVQPASNVVNGPLTNRGAIVTDAFGVPLNDGSTGSPIEFNPAQVTNPTINGPFSNRGAIVTDAFGVPLNDGATGSPIQFNPAQVTNPTVSGPISGAKAVTRDAFGVPLNDGSTGETISFNPAQVTNPTVAGPISGGKPVARDAFGVPLNDGTTGSPIQFNPVAVEDQRITGPLGGNRASAKVAQNGNSPASGVTNGSGAVVPTGGVVGDGVGERSGASARGLRQDSTVGDGSGNTDLAVAGFSKKQLSVWRTAVNELGQNHPALEGINQLVSENKLGKAQAAITAAKSGAATEIKLGSVQRKVLDHVSAAFTSGDIDSVYDGKTFKVAEIGRALNMKPGSVKMALNGLKERLVPLMKKSRERTVEAADQEKLGLSPKVQRTDVVNEADLFGSEEGGVEQSMGVISSIGGSQSAVGDNVAPPDDKGVQTAEEVTREQRVAEEARLSAEAEIENILSTADALPAAGDFNSMFGEGTWDKLTRPEQAEFVVAYQNALFEYETYDEVEQALLKEFEEYGQLAETNGSQGLQDPERVSGVKGRPVVLPDGGQAEIANGENGTPQAGESVTDEAARRGDSEAESGVTSSTPSDEAGFGDGKKFSKADATAVDRLNAAVERWSKIVSDYLARKLDRTKTYVFLDSTPASMQALGLPDLEIRTGMHMLDKANVRLTAEQLKDLPRQLANPKIVYIHDGEKGLSINFVTEYGNGAGNVVIALKPNQYVREAAKTHFVATIVNVPAHNIVREIRNGNGLFVQSKDALEGLRGAIDTAQKQNGRQASEVRAQLARTYNLSSVTKRLLFPSDLVKLIADGRAKYSTGASGSTTVDAINKQLRSLFFSGTRFTNRVVVVENAEALPESLRSDVDGATQAFVQGGKVYMIAGNIAKGNELAVFLHEVGVHLGMKNLLGATNFSKLVEQVKVWAESSDSKEGDLARAALRRVMRAEEGIGEEYGQEDFDEELVAYFTEEAVKSGINPTAIAKSGGPIQQWFRTLWAAVKVALRKFGLDRVDTLTAENVVDLAYGAARLELEGTWHGTAADFRNFNHDYMGSGEGAQAFGWGTYLAQRVGIAKGYWEDDVRRKATQGVPELANFKAGDTVKGTGTDWDGAKIVDTRPGAVKINIFGRDAWVSTNAPTQPEGSIMRVDTAVHDDEMLDWDKPLSEQSEVVKEALASVGISQQGEWNPTGENLYRTLQNDEDRLDESGFEATDKGASEYLDSIGIKGIKFLDSQSRDIMSVEAAQAELEKRQNLLKYKEAELSGAKVSYAHKPDSFVITSLENNVEAAKRKVAAAEKLLEAAKAGPTKNLVIFNDKNVQRVATQVGANRDRVKFSKNYTASLIEALPESARAPVSVVSENVKDAVKRLFNYSIFTNDLGELAEKHIPSVKQWLDAIRERDVTRIKHEEKIDDIASLVDRLKDREQFNRTWKLIKDMTISQKWGFKPTWRTEVQVDQEMAARYDALTAEERNIIDQVFKHGDQTQREIQSILDETLKHEFDLAQAKAKTPKDRADLDAEFKKFKLMYGRKLAMPDGPYAPLRRVGTHVVIAKSQRFKDAEALGADLTELKQDENHYFVNFYDSLGEAKVQAQALVRKFGEGNVIASEKDASWQDNNMFPFQAFDKLRTMVSEREDRAAGSMLKLLNELYLVSLAETSARKSELSRTNAAGIDEQGMYRAFVSKGKADAHYIGTLKNGKAVTDAEYAMRDQVKDSSDREAAMRYFNELMKRYENTSKYSPAPLVQKLMQFNSLWHLLTKPAYFVYNATQPLMMTLPTLTGRFGYGRSSDAMMRAYRESIAVPNLFSRERINFAAMPADVRGAMNELLNRGKLDITILMDLGDRVHAGRSKISRGMATVDGALKNVASKTEMLNRLVTGMSAYRLAIGDGRTHADAVNYAAKVIDETQGDYTNFNAPRLMNASSTAKLVTQFRKFQLVQLSFMVKLVKQSKADPVARKALAFVLAHHAIMAGSLGLPAANLVALAFAAMGGDDEPRDLELSMRKEIGDEFMADLLTRGVPAALLNINMSGNVGMGQMFSLLPFTDVDLSSRDGAAKTAFGLLGPVSGNVANMADGVGYFQNGDYYRGLEAMLPSGIKGAMKGLREAGDGVTNKRGDTLLTPEEIDLWSTMAKVAGFRTTDDTLRQLVTGKRYEFEQYFNDHTSKIKNAYVKAYRSGDSDTTAELRERWTAMQDNKRNLGFSTQGLSNLLKAPQEAVKRERATVNGVQTTKSNRGFVEAATQ